ncbi:TetR family transcriptional regulator [Nocardia mangyaensis]|uniref:TetR family transcriptional regulator n=1 Tax=Nocardia mangyaensis TaxID=2213200 RepID=A0A1J0VUY2_9NOCA|nr:TetR/AcrR family transcriptional regulator [Nocardia mangyaensis]APE35867.1 TetR family transcriptional regulator [Nocardia mangyaensis]
MPKLWNDTISEHRRGVREAILDTTWELVNELGPTGVKMSEIAERTGIGRATLYKYFPDIEAILAAWHFRQVTRQVVYIAEIRDSTTDPMGRLSAVLGAYGHHQRHRAQHHRHQPHGSELAILLHRSDGQVEAAQRQLHALFTDLVADAAREGGIRTDVSVGELATYCLHALTAADAMADDQALDRLVAVILRGLRLAV